MLFTVSLSQPTNHLSSSMHSGSGFQKVKQLLLVQTEVLFIFFFNFVQLLWISFDQSLWFHALNKHRLLLCCHADRLGISAPSIYQAILLKFKWKWPRTLWYEIPNIEWRGGFRISRIPCRLSSRDDFTLPLSQNDHWLCCEEKYHFSTAVEVFWNCLNIHSLNLSYNKAIVKQKRS